MTNLTLQPGRDYTLPAGDFTLVGDTHYWGVIQCDPNTRIVGTQRLYLRDDTGTKMTKINGGKLAGPKLYIDRIGGMNANITVNNVEFLSGSGIESKSGLRNSVISNCALIGHPGHPIYGDGGYDGLTINNNEFTDCRGGTHLDAPIGASSRNLFYEQNYTVGWSAISLELQTQAQNVIVQDNVWGQPIVKNPADLCPISAPLDASTMIRIHRNLIEGNINHVWMIEGGGDDAIYEDNAFGTAKNGVIVTDSRGTWNVTVRNNLMPAGLKIGANNNLGVLTQGNNGPGVQLTWDINRRRGGRNYRLGQTPPIIIPPIETVSKAQYDLIVADRDRLRTRLNGISVEAAKP